jgi:hypothetical protein
MYESVLDDDVLVAVVAGWVDEDAPFPPSPFVFPLLLLLASAVVVNDDED